MDETSSIYHPHTYRSNPLCNLAKAFFVVVSTKKEKKNYIKLYKMRISMRRPIAKKPYFAKEGIEKAKKKKI